MWRLLVSWLASLLIVLGCQLPCRAQAPAPAPGPTTGGASQPPETTTERPPAVAWGLAVIFTLVILLIVCMPSRKSESEAETES